MRGTGRSEEQWQNWAGNQSARPAQVAQARDVDDVALVLRSAADRGLRVRPVGAGHSFTAAAVTDGVLLRLDHLSGVTGIDHATGRVRVLAGTRLHELNPALQAVGLALPNLGDIDRQSISGAIATGTHGTGARLRGIASAVTGLTLVLADGSVRAVLGPGAARGLRGGPGGAGRAGRGHRGRAAVRAGLPAPRRRAPGAAAAAPRAGAGRGRRPRPLRVLLVSPHRPRPDEAQQPGGGEGAVGPLPPWRAWLDDELLANRLFELTNRASARWPRIVPRLAGLTSRGLSGRDTRTTRGASSARTEP